MYTAGMRHAGGNTLRILIALCVAVSLLLACGAGTGHGHVALFLPVLGIILLLAPAPAGRCRIIFDAPLRPAPARVPSLPRAPPV
jgi:hypothetical protein